VPEFVSLIPRSAVDTETAHAAGDWPQVIARLRRHELLLVRSDGPDETARPGAGLSLTARPDELLGALHRAGADPTSAWPLIQVAVQPSAAGVLSNDRRVSPRRDNWMAEGPITTLRPQVATIGPSRRQADFTRPLEAAHDLRPALRSIARYLAHYRVRHRVEWVWDGRAVWVVQLDELADPVTDPTAARHLNREPPRGRSPAAPSPQRCEWDGPKIQSHQMFERIGLPTVSVAARRADRLGQESELREWLASVLMAHDDPIVLRTDVSAGTGEPVLLPTSAPSRDVEDLARFARGALRSITDTGVSSHDAALLASPLVPAVASAVATLGESRGQVDIDSLWGFPDGLLHLPHDSTTVRGRRVETERRRKGACLLLSTTGERFEAQLGAPWDWGRTIRDDEARTIASWTRQISEALERRVHLMVLARVGGRRGGPGLLPFHFFEHPGTVRDSGVRPYRGRSVCVQSAQDLRGEPDVEWIYLRPRLELARDPRFLAAVAEFAVRRNLPIAFSGSRLGHARYILERRGATVFFAADAPEPTPMVALVARSRGGMLRLMHTDEAAAAAAIGIDLGRPGTLSVPQLLCLRNELPSHPTMPGVPWLSDTASKSLRSPPDLPGLALGFME
jgi:hypothetical protein